MRYEDSLDRREAWTRRRLLRRAAELGALSAVPAFVAACGSDDKSATSGSTSTGGGATTAPEVSGTIALLTYPDWIGDKEVQWFEAKHPSVKVKQIAETTSGAAATVALLARNKGDYDFTLGGLTIGLQLQAAGLLEQFDRDRAPNARNFPDMVLDAMPIGLPGDIGKTGFAYRKDLMPERPTSWADFWNLTMGKYSGKSTMFKYDVDVTGAALIHTGHDVNATDQAAIDDAKKALIDIKPHLRALLSTNLSKPLLAGTAVMAVDYDYDIAAAQAKNPNIVWVAPEEGMPAYIEGWIPLKDSKNLDTVYAFFDAHSTPKYYANYINTLGVSYLMPKARPLIKESIRNNPTLRFDEAEFQRTTFVKFLGAEASARRAKMWEEFLAA